MSLHSFGRRMVSGLGLFVILSSIFVVPVQALGFDTDGDGLFDEDEAALGFDPLVPDTDLDATLDGVEDLDGDGLSEVAELYTYLTNPLSADSDGDGLSDGAEVSLGTHPLDSDTDNDGTTDGAEVTAGTNPFLDERVLTVEAGPDEGFGFGEPMVFDERAYFYGLGSETVISATIDWGDGSSDVATLEAGSDRIFIQGSHNYEWRETFTVTVCVTTLFEPIQCDTAKISIVGSSSNGSSSESSVVLAGEDDEEDIVETTDASIEETTDETDQEVILAGDDEAADCSAMAFEDVSEGDDFYDAVCEMWAAGVIHGKTATFFDLEDVIRRDEAAKIFTRLFGYVTEPYGETPEVEESSFVDVEAEDPLAYYVEVAVTEEIMEPDTDSVENEAGEVVDESSFRPHEALTVYELEQSLDRIDGDLNGALEEEGYEKGDLGEEGFEPEGTITRGNFLNLLVDFLK